MGLAAIEIIARGIAEPHEILASNVPRDQGGDGGRLDGNDEQQQDTGGLCSGEHGRMACLVCQQPSLECQAATVSGQRAIGANDAMAGDDNGNRVGAIRCTNRTTGTLASENRREMSVRGRRSRWNRPQCPPHIALERRAPGGDRNGIEGIQTALEVGLKAPLDDVGCPILGQQVLPVMHLQQPVQLLHTLAKVECAEHVRFIRDEQQG